MNFFKNLLDWETPKRKKSEPQVKPPVQRRSSVDSLYPEPPRSRRSSLSSGTHVDSTLSGSSNRSNRSAHTYSLKTDTDIPRTISSRRSSGASTISSTSSRKSSLSDPSAKDFLNLSNNVKSPKTKTKSPKSPNSKKSKNSRKTVRTAKSSSWEDEDIFSMSGVGQYRRRSL